MFTNRELAISFWLIVLFVFFLVNKGTRESLSNVFKVLCSKIILCVFSIMFIYIAGIIYFLFILGYWDTNLTKDTLIWVTFTAFALLFNSTDKALQEGFFKRKVIESIKIIVVIQFIANAYTFRLLPEIILTFVLVFLGALQAVASFEEKYKQVEKLITTLISILGLMIFANAIHLTVKDFHTFGSLDTLKSFLLPIILTVLYLPLVYCMSLYTIYDHINARLKMKSYIDKKLRRYIIRNIFLKYHFKLHSLRKFQTHSLLNLVKFRSREEVKQYFHKNVVRI
ncbi:hypothetical protein [Anoxynatronum buryatiense]|uniref:Uncharacterized protein n=1 Tax=Anoxynatronum buryatiense TaxID=489973 RepID=A0AA45WZL1_9CLOT|nr:hypothetical protein [Anoxynatronum buryatiense]SMP68591.1 hypothetical protein SAMN06296020_11726 [Anoxynatronum buryatiense]